MNTPVMMRVSYRDYLVIHAVLNGMLAHQAEVMANAPKAAVTRIKGPVLVVHRIMVRVCQLL